MFDPATLVKMEAAGVAHVYETVFSGPALGRQISAEGVELKGPIRYYILYSFGARPNPLSVDGV